MILGRGMAGSQGPLILGRGMGAWKSDWRVMGVPPDSGVKERRVLGPGGLWVDSGWTPGGLWASLLISRVQTSTGVA